MFQILKDATNETTTLMQYVLGKPLKNIITMTKYLTDMIFYLGPLS